MAQRFKKSGKDKLVLLMVSDFDPDGEEIAHSFARSMRDDFGVADIHPIKVALTAAQVKEVIEKSVVPVNRMVKRPGDAKLVPFTDLCVTGGMVNVEKAAQLAAKTQGKKKVIAIVP